MSAIQWPHSADPKRPVAGLSLSVILDELDYPMIAVTPSLEVLLCNRAARFQRQSEGHLRVEGGELRWTGNAGQALQEAIAAAASKGTRKLVTFAPGGDNELTVAVLPLVLDGLRCAMLILPRPTLCEELSIHGYARDTGLTPGEAEVLRALCAGHTPARIARQRGVCMSTIRTQISALRAKTGATDLRDLVRKIATLPPVVGTLSMLPMASH